IRQVPLLTVEGEKDDITGVGQCSAAHNLCTGLPDSMKKQYIQQGVGHYGVFNGSRFRNEIAPRISQFIDRYEPAKAVRNRPNGQKTKKSGLIDAI
ncbi:MAG: polyhydroxyalkanoate depolymerase, partial [Methyloligellaceae bacterium]